MTSQQDPTKSNDDPLTLDHYAADAKTLDDRAFAARHGQAFLLHHGEIGDLQPARLGQDTLLSDGPNGSPREARLSFLVFPVRATGKSQFPGFVSIGRTPNNDIVINDASVSNFHAFCRLNQDGVVTVQDAGSKNGTHVNDKRVAAKGEGEGTLLVEGDTLVLGNVRLSFLTAAGFRNLVAQLAG